MRGLAENRDQPSYDSRLASWPYPARITDAGGRPRLVPQMRIWTARRTRVLVPTGSLSGLRLALARSSHLPTAHRSRPEVSKPDRARDQVHQTSPRWEGTVNTSPRVGCIEICASWQHWPCLFPQHGPGRKHHRSIVLEDWQNRIVGCYPRQLLRGLIHSDGCRTINRVRDGRYAIRATSSPTTRRTSSRSSGRRAMPPSSLIPPRSSTPSR